MQSLPLKKRLTTISLRLPLLNALVILGLGLVMLGSSVWRAHSSLVERLSQQLSRIVATAALQIDGDVHRNFNTQDATLDPDWQRIRHYLSQVREMNDLESDHLYTFNFPAGDTQRLNFAVMLHESPFVGDVYEVHPNNLALIKRVRDGGEVVASGIYQNQNGTWLSAFAPIKDHRGQVIGMLEADYRLDEDNETYIAALSSSILAILPVFLILIGLGFLLTFLIARTVSKPIRELVNVTENTAAGHWEKPVPEVHWEELQRLGRALGSMRHKIQNQMSHLQELNSELERKVVERTGYLTELNDQLTAIQGIIASVNEMTSLEEILRRIGLAVKDLVGMDTLALLIPLRHQPSANEQCTVEQFSLFPTPDSWRVDYQCASLALAPPSHTNCMNLEDLDPATKTQIAQCRCFPESGSTLLMPLWVRREWIGTLVVGRSDSVVYGEADRATLDTLAMHIAAAVQKARLIDSLSSLNEEIRQAKENLEERTQVELDYRKNHDDLTGLKNRAYLKDRVAIEIAKAQVNQDKLGLIHLDVDHFKKVNDSLGTDMGDKVLKEVAKRLAGHLREQDTLARVGGNEFCVLLPDLFNEKDAGGLARRLGQALAKPFLIGRIPIHLTVSSGIATFPTGCEGPDGLLSNAAIALKRAKQAGGNREIYFQLEMNVESERRLILEDALREAIETASMELVYQPQTRLADRHMIGCEALLRWDHRDLGQVSPKEFIPLAEITGLIIPLGWWVIREVCEQIDRWQNAGLATLPVGINISARQFQQKDLVTQLKAILAETGVDPGLIELEITESVAMENVEDTLATLLELKTLGITLAIDDFGTGYSSLSYLKKFPIDRLKIDRSFVTDLTENESDAAIVSAIIQMGQGLGLKVIAEGVETGAQLRFLFEQGCDQVQGFFLSHPLPASAVQEMLANRGLGLNLHSPTWEH